MIPRLQASETTSLVALPVAVDLIRFEKNLLQIGFFGAHDTRHNNQSTRRIEQWVNRNGQKIKVAAEFRGSGAMGLPSTSDRDKYIAFMKIAMDRRARLGQIENPIRFTGYQMLKELGLTYSGENYDDINRWGQRMADTTITSEQVIYLAARKKYANTTVHVFRSFLRAGQSNLDESGRAEHYEVVLEDWLLENLNQSYVIPEDFNSYRRLKRATAKGIFGYLHLWFHASQGRPVEKDYTELCMLLNIPVYRHVSKIRETMGRSLDELASIGYLSNWDVRRMVSKDGFKLVLLPGAELLHVLAISQRKSLPDGVARETALDESQREAVRSLMERGVHEAKAQALARRQNAAVIADQIEYGEHLMARDRRGKIENPAGFLVYLIENRVPVPAGFETSRKRRRQREIAESEAARMLHRIRLEEAYEEFVRLQVDEEIGRRLPGEKFANRVRSIVSTQVRRDDRFAHMAPEHQIPIAEQFARREVQDSMTLPGFEEWCEASPQLALFAAASAL